LCFQRSVSPSKFESQATGSPTKLSVPNRKLRNQPANRIHDIEFAAEISTSLIAQVRNLQSLLAEKDEELKDTQSEKARLEIDTEGLQQRLKVLDESEHRYKDENWTLETQIQELLAAQKEAADKEKRLTQSFNVLQSEKNKTQRELDEVKVSYAKLSDEHTTTVKHHDIELGAAKRSAATAENERITLQRKIEDLTSQNQELAKAYGSQRGRQLEREAAAGLSDEDFETAADNVTPEHSPPPSPVKGTPRHSMLESETLKTSLHHAQRTIMSQRTQLHREKTEKLDLKRLLQDARDEVDRLRHESGGASSRRLKKTDSRDSKKQPKLLGGVRATRDEFYMEDPDWEDQEEGARTSPRASAAALVSSGHDESSDHFETANETSDAAFETANERGTETEDFQTGAEEFSDADSDAQTETESPSKGAGRSKRPPLSHMNLRANNRLSFQSTASTSNDDEDEDDFGELKTPTSVQPQKMRLRVSRGLLRRPRQASEEPFQSSPASFANSSNAGTPQQPGQSLFAELADLEGSDDESYGGTPSRPPFGASAPNSVSKGSGSVLKNMSSSQNLAMRDSGIMTEPEVPAIPAMVHTGAQTEEAQEDEILHSPVSVIHHERPMSMDSVIGPGDSRSSGHWLSPDERSETDASRHLSTFSYSDAGAQHDPDMGQKLSMFPIPPATIPRKPSLPVLSLTAMVSEAVEPIAEPEVPAPTFTMSSVQTEVVEPKPELVIEAPVPSLSMAVIDIQSVEPVSEPVVETPLPSLSMATIDSQFVEPIAEPVVEEAPLPLSSVVKMDAQSVEPVMELYRPSLTTTAAMKTVAVEPVAEPVETPAVPAVVVPPRAPLSLSSVESQSSEPIVESVAPPPPTPRLSFASMLSQELQPRGEPTPERVPFAMSAIVSEHVAPVRPPSPAGVARPAFGFSSIESIETRPDTPRSPKRDGFIIPRDMDMPLESDRPKSTGLFGSVLGWGKSRSSTPPIIAEDETRQSPRDTPQPETPESQRPLKDMSTNTNTRPTRKPKVVPTSDSGAQTTLTADLLDQMMKAKRRPHDYSHERQLSLGSSMGTPGTVRIRRGSQDSMGSIPSPSRAKGKMVDAAADGFRPSSSSSSKAGLQTLPPLPPNHLLAIEAARAGSSGGGQGTIGSMGPPLWPASAMRNNRPKTPIGQKPGSPNSVPGTPTPRPTRTGSALGNAEIHSITKYSQRSRQSSVSSFASEIDSRFNINTAMGYGTEAAGFGPNTDPRMIQAITQTMIGEFLWKYTRKTGRSEPSSTRHRRYFWVHPYTRTLYWSDKDPQSASRNELRTKSVAIEAVRVVTDDNPFPPGLHRKSLVVISPGRTVKFTCTTGSRHETWFNALSYLLLRTNHEGHSDAEEIAGQITSEDVAEFNPQFGRRQTNGTRPRPPPSLSSYNSRGTRTESPAIETNMNIPTLTPSHRKNAEQRPSLGTLSRISGYWKSSQVLTGTLGSLRGRHNSVSKEAGIYEAQAAHDSAEDVREMIERQDREADRLENVRACCDGKHDVGTLTGTMKRKGSQNTHSHQHTPQAGQSTASTPAGTVRSRR